MIVGTLFIVLCRLKQRLPQLGGSQEQRVLHMRITRTNSPVGLFDCQRRV
jgi:hypothetical protein